MGADAPHPPGHGRDRNHYGRFLDHASRDAALEALALGQHTVFSLDQLRGLGFTKRVVHRRVAHHRLFRIHQSVFSFVPRKLLSRHGHWMAAVLACGPNAVLSHRSAAALHEIRATWRTNIDVTIRARSARRHEGIDIHRSTTLTDRDVTVVQGIPCTSVARTALDFAAVVPRRSTERALDQMEITDLFDLSAIADQLGRNPNHRGARTLNAILDEYYVGSAPTESALEEAALALCRRLQIPMPRVQRWLRLPDGGPALRPDFTWPEQRVILETDGDRVHRTRQAREQRNLKDQRLIAHGWKPLHASWRQVTRRPQELELTLVRLVRSPGPAPPRAAAG